MYSKNKLFIIHDLTKYLYFLHFLNSKLKIGYFVGYPQFF
ncbi:hypothetical protein RC62_467 [Flavobacterium aquidurense]|uniref:Uncharacterized protein n=1 Tax=Flavobacterium aquidurense TaxID=362413 RepID=A0A0N8VMX9_9FLAO|nr:hypothetical protein RC62_467 [Flavobacterium aquidurense]